MIDLYTWSTPNGRKVSIMLEECKINYNLMPVNIMKNEQFEKNFLEYWMDDSYNSKRYPYSRYVFDYKEHKNVISFRVEDYIQNHTDIGIDTLTI
mgnify:CR=1 FL=1